MMKDLSIIFSMDYLGYEFSVRLLQIRGLDCGTFLQQLECGYEFPALIYVWIASAVVFRGERVQNPGFLLVLNFVYIFFWFLDLVALKQKYLNILPLKVIWSLSFWLKTEGFANIAFFWVFWENTIADLNFGLRVLE